MKAAELLGMVRRCAASARAHEPAEIDARARAFVAMLSGSLEQYDAIAADMVFSILQQPVKDVPK
jgi:3-hydroxyacyl-CoA dehydrogenase